MGNIANVVHKKGISNEQMKNLFNSDKLGPEEHNYRGKTNFNSVSFLADSDKTINVS